MGAFEYWQLEEGDIDGKGGVTVADALISLEVAAGLNPTALHQEAEVDGDQKIDIKEALHTLVSGQAIQCEVNVSQ